LYGLDENRARGRASNGDGERAARFRQEKHCRISATDSQQNVIRQQFGSSAPLAFLDAGRKYKPGAKTVNRS
jgi:hypothetical protein